MVQVTTLTAAEVAERAREYDQKRRAKEEAWLTEQQVCISTLPTPSGHTHPTPPEMAPPIERATPEHPVGVLALTARVEVPLVELLRERDELSDGDILTKYGPRLLMLALDQIERFRTSNEIDRITPKELQAMRQE